MSVSDENTAEIINKMFNENKIADLREFIGKRSCLNSSNQYLTYLFYFFQTCGVFSVSLGQAYSNAYLSWSGVGLNSLASFVYIVINSNSKINNQLLKNIQLIKDNRYVDEGVLDAINDIKKSSQNTPIELKQPPFRRSTTATEV
jgi:hypothetical protein